MVVRQHLPHSALNVTSKICQLRYFPGYKGILVQTHVKEHVVLCKHLGFQLPTWNMPGGSTIPKYHFKNIQTSFPSCCFPDKMFAWSAEAIFLNILLQVISICTATPHRELSMVLQSINTAPCLWLAGSCDASSKSHRLHLLCSRGVIQQIKQHFLSTSFNTGVISQCMHLKWIVTTTEE